MSFDLDAVANDGEPFEFTFGGETFSFPADAPMAFNSLISEGHDLEGFRLLFGDEQWARVEAMPDKLGTRKARALLKAYNEHLGFASSGGS